MNKIILAANPSYQTSMEADFWRQFERTAKGENWEVVKHAMRKIPCDENTIILPARLKDVANFLGAPAVSQAFSLPQWMSQKDFYRLLEWEYKRWGLGGYEKFCEVGLKKLAWHVDDLFKELNPAIVIVTNKIDHGCALFDMAGRHYGSDVIFFERSASDTFFAEPYGMFGESVIWESFLARDKTHDARWSLEGERVSDRIRENPNGFRPQNSGTAVAEKVFANAKKPIFFLPMDNTLWTGWAQTNHPQKHKDYGEDFPSPSEAINRVAQIADSMGGSLIVKRHPADKEEYDLEYDNTIVIETPIGTALSHADVCIAFLTKVAFVSAVSSVPTVVMGHNPVAASGAVFHPTSTAEWEAEIIKALAVSDAELEASLKQFELFVGWLESEFFLTSGGHINFAKPNAIDFALSTIRKNEDKVSGGPFTSRDNLRRVIGRMRKRLWVSGGDPVKVDATSPITVLFNVTALGDETYPEHRYTASVCEELGNIAGITLYPFVTTASKMKAGDISTLSKRLDRKVWREKTLSEIDFDGLVVNYSTANVVPGDKLPKTAINVVTLHNHSGYEVQHSENPIHHIVMNSRKAASAHDSKQDDQTVPVDCIYLGSGPEYHRRTDKKDLVRFLKKNGLTYRDYFVVDHLNEESAEFENILTAASGLISNDVSETCKVVFLGPKIAMNNADSEAFKGTKTKRIIFVSELSDAERSMLYSGAMGFVATDSAQTSSLTSIDAMRCGCPIIAPSSRGDITEIVGDAGLYYDATSSNSLNVAMRTLLSDNNIRVLLGDAVSQKSANMTWANVGIDLQDLFTTITDNVAFDPSGFEELFADDPITGKPDICTDWNAVGGQLVASSTLSVVGEHLDKTKVFIEDEDKRAHVISSEVTSQGNAFVASIIVKELARHRFVFSIAQHSGDGETSKIECFVDLQERKILKSRIATGDVLILDSRINALDNGWRKIDVHFVWKDVGPQTLKLLFGSISDRKYTSKYLGKGEKAFAIVAGSLTASA